MKRTLLLFVSVIIYVIIQAQIPKTPQNLITPNAASLGQYGEIPVSLFTGTPTINVPIYEIKTKSLSVPISLSYHSAGIRPDQHPGWVGLGWTLNAGGMITRVVKNAPDDYCKVNSTSGLTSKYGYYYTHDMLDATDWYDKRMIDIVQNTGEKYTDMDSETDEYSFNFLGYSGKFYMDELGQWKVYCEQPLKVEFTGTFTGLPYMNHVTTVGQPKHFSEFTITDDKGVKYVFGNDATEYSVNFFKQKKTSEDNQNDLYGEWVATSWMLTKIILTDNSTVNFNYKRGPFINQLYKSLYQNEGTKSTTSDRIYETNESTLSLILSIGGSLMSPVYLSGIKSPNDTITFEKSSSTELAYDQEDYLKQSLVVGPLYNTEPEMPYLDLKYSTDYPFYDFPEKLNNLEWQQLDKVKVVNVNNKFIKTVCLSYSKDRKQRLTLYGIKEVSSTSDTIGRYSFDYYNINKMPKYLSQKTDHWGFYSGVAYNPANGDIANYSTWREPSTNVDTVSMGALKKITYPTGGSTEFIYEPHDYQTGLDVLRWDKVIRYQYKRPAGGLRIKRIISKLDDSQVTTSKEYIYQNDYGSKNPSSSGVLGGQTMYRFLNYKVSAFNANLTVYKNIFTSNGVLPASENSLGCHVGYSTVIEMDSNSSFVRYKFSNFDNGYKDKPYLKCIQPNLSPYQPFCSMKNYRGKLLSKEVFNRHGEIQSKVSYSYILKDSATNYVKAIHVLADYAVEGNPGIFYADGASYKIFTYPMLLSKTRDVTFYSNTDSLVKESKITYDRYTPLIVNKTEKNSKGDTLSTTYLYPFNIAYNYTPESDTNPHITPSTNPSYFNYFSMVSKNFLNYPIEITKSKNGKVIDNKVITYGLYNSSYFPDSVFSYNISTPLTNFKHYHPVVGQNYAKSLLLSYKYDSKADIIQVKNIDDTYTTYLWGYNYQYLIAEIKNATYDQVKTALGVDPETIAASSNPDMTKIDALRGQLPRCMITTYTYLPAIGTMTKTDQHGVKTFYEYDTASRLEKIKNHESSTIQSFEYKYKH